MSTMMTYIFAGVIVMILIIAILYVISNDFRKGKIILFLLLLFVCPILAILWLVISLFIYYCNGDKND